MVNNNLLSDELKSLNSGILYLDQKKYELATKELCKVLEINPKNDIALIKLGHVYLQQKKFFEAIAQFEKSLELNPHSADPHEGLGFCYFEQGYLEKALIKFNYVLNFNPNNEHVHFGLGLCYHQKKEFNKAIEEFNKVLKINPHHLQVKYHLELCHMQLGHAYFEVKKYPEAIAQFKKALNLNVQASNLAGIYISMGETYLSMKKYGLTIKNLKKAADMTPSDKRINELISKAYIGTHNYDLAADALINNHNSIDTETPFIKNDILNKQTGCRIKIFRIPNFYGIEVLSTEMNSIMLPPLALGNIVSYIRSQGISIDQDDLHIKIHYDNYFSKDQEDKIDESVFFDELRIVEYTKGNKDTEIDKIMERTDNKTDLTGYKITLFSLDSCSMNFSHVMFALCFARYLKKKYDPIIILGGLTYFPELMQKMKCEWPDIDYVICKEGEEVLGKLLHSLLEDFSIKTKTMTEKSQRILFAGKVPKPVKPDFDGLPLDKYKYQGLKADYSEDKKLHNLVKEFNASKAFLLPFKFIKGCTNRCIFCASSYGGLVHVVNPETVAYWLEDLQARYNPTGYLFLNDTLNISKKYLDQICNEIIKRKLKIRWSDCVRVDRLDKESIYKMREAGCIRMVFGMETASRRLLRYIKKEIDLKQLEDMLYWADKLNIWTGIEIISGLPYENKKDVEETISFLKRNKEHIDALYYNAFNIKDTSLMQIYPEKYGITNIFELSNYEDGFSTFVKYGFDEARGLKWPEKKKQIIWAINKIIENFGESPFPEPEYEQFLFFLYSKYSNKKIIRNLFYSIGAEKIKYAKILHKKKTSGQFLRKAAEKTLVYGS